MSTDNVLKTYIVMPTKDKKKIGSLLHQNIVRFRRMVQTEEIRTTNLGGERYSEGMKIETTLSIERIAEIFDHNDATRGKYRLNVVKSENGSQLDKLTTTDEHYSDLAARVGELGTELALTQGRLAKAVEAKEKADQRFQNQRDTIEVVANLGAEALGIDEIARGPDGELLLSGFLDAIEELKADNDRLTNDVHIAMGDGIDGLSNEDLLLETIKRSYAKEFAIASDKYDRIFPEGISKAMIASTTPELEYVIEGLTRKELHNLDIDVDKLVNPAELKNELEFRTREYKDVATDDENHEYTLSEAFQQRHATLQLEKGQDPNYDRAVEFVREYKKARRKWNQRRKLAKSLVSLVDDLVEEHKTLRGDIGEVNAGLTVGCYMYAVADIENDDYRLTFAIPASENTIKSGLGIVTMQALVTATKSFGDDVSVSYSRGVTRVNINYDKSSMPDEKRLTEIKKVVDREVSHSTFNRLGMRMDLGYFGRYNV